MSAPILLALGELSFIDREHNTEKNSEQCRVSTDGGANWQAMSLSEVSDRYTSANAQQSSRSPDKKSMPEEDNSAMVQATVLIPSHYALCSSIEVPKKQQRHLERILPFLCEEKIANDLDHAHIATGAIDPATNQLAIRVIDKHLLEKLLTRLQSHQIQPEHLFCDNELLGTKHNTLWFDDQVVSLITATDRITSDAGNAVAIIDQWFTIQPANQLETLEIVSPLDNLSTQLQLTLEQWRSQGADIKLHLSAPSGECLTESWCLALQDKSAAVELLTSKGVDLLCGDYQPALRQSNTYRWKPLLVTACALLALNITYLLASGLYWQSQANALNEKSNALYREYFPQDKRIINIKTQTLNHLNQHSNTTDSGALQLLTDFLPGWQAHRHSIELQSLRYQQQRNELILEIDAKSIGQLDQLQQSLGKRAELLSANEDSNQGARGRLKFKGASAQ